MASELYVETLKGLTSGANANKVIIPSGQTLYAPGHVIQVVQTIYDSASSITTTSNLTYIDSGISVTITPSSTSSKILVRAFVQMYINSNVHGKIAIFKNDTNELVQSSVLLPESASAGQGMIEILDSPSATSATKYSIYFCRNGGSGTVYLNGEGDSNCGITAMEIAG